ncbi:hypothetical protein HEQ69_08565 [Haematospirillum jordaniae]|uniref:hypothetical protein n=1 Tax=Haematospirillum jordaniae TaxID=1549855 RepID=UPI00143321C2|nr:hypothetical protein [Haematospirillum jordaniae]NKD45764.1 hypothetical protein [Haematospirillum jordaniae]NKD91954.1 hypothetical protein [Haematospirillum jordaniae]
MTIIHQIDLLQPLLWQTVADPPMGQVVTGRGRALVTQGHRQRINAPFLLELFRLGVVFPYLLIDPDRSLCNREERNPEPHQRRDHDPANKASPEKRHTRRPQSACIRLAARATSWTVANVGPADVSAALSKREPVVVGSDEPDIVYLPLGH